METDPLEKAIRACGNSQAALGGRIGASQQRISHWLKRRREVGVEKFPVPAEFAIPIETATNGAVPRWEVRPDIFPRPVEAAE